MHPLSCLSVHTNPCPRMPIWHSPEQTNMDQHTYILSWAYAYEWHHIEPASCCWVRNIVLQSPVFKYYSKKGLYDHWPSCLLKSKVHRLCTKPHIGPSYYGVGFFNTQYGTRLQDTLNVSTVQQCIPIWHRYGTECTVQYNTIPTVTVKLLKNL